MRRYSLGFGVLLIGAILLCSPSQLAADPIIQFSVHNLGGTVYQADYFVSNYNFAENQGFSIFFDETLYASLQALNIPAGWDVFVLQPDLLLPAPGVYDTLVLIAGPALTDPFSVSFTWSGAGTPGSQPFEVDQFDTEGNFFLLGVGQTIPLQTSEVPEPGTLTLLAAGLLGLLVSLRIRTI